MSELNDESALLLADDWRTNHIYAGGLVVISVILMIACFVIYVENHRQHCPEIREIRASSFVIIVAGIIWLITGSRKL